LSFSFHTLLMSKEKETREALGVVTLASGLEIGLIESQLAALLAEDYVQRDGQRMIWNVWLHIFSR